MHCPACGGPALPQTLSVNEMMFGGGERFEYAVCGTCGTLWLVDVPVDLGAYYPSDYYSIDLDPTVAIGRAGVRQVARTMSRSILFGHARLAHASARFVRMRQYHSFLRVLDSMAFSGLPEGRRTRVLDVGCGSGLMVYALALAGIEDAVGIDPFAAADREFDTGARLFRRDLSQVEESFDLVMFHHSFEHVPDPESDLAHAARILSPGGRILVRMPTCSSEAYERYGADWVQLDAPRHLTIFSREGIAALAERVGLKVAAVKDDSNSFQFWGSEQVRRAIPLMDDRSFLISEKDSDFTRREIDEWEREAQRLNRTGRGDQAAWVLTRG